jgi:hypothetical protein
MKSKHLRWWLGLGLLNFMVAGAMGGTTTVGSTNSTVQSSLRPLGWSIYANVKKLTTIAPTDELALDFKNNLSVFTSYTASLKEGVAYAAATNNKLDPQRLYFFADYAPRIYFISNGGWYTDGLGVTIGPAIAPDGTPPEGTNYLVFPSLNSCYSNTCPSKQTGGSRTSSVPLLTGDFVQLPTIHVGQQLAIVFFANLNSLGTPANVFYNDPNANQDHYQHVIAFFPNNSRYFIVGFEDLYGGGDGDYNDAIIVIDVGDTNASLWRNGTLPR